MLIISILAVLCFYYGFTNDNRILIVLGVLFTIGILIQYFGHVESQIIIDDTTLKVTRKISGLMLSEDEIALSDIQATHFEQKTYDSFRLLSGLFWELFFPSNPSYFTVHTVNGRKKEFGINTSEKEIAAILERLPERIPN